MAKGDDTVTKKRNKAKRKKLNRENSSNVSARVASIIAAKKRRLSGKRRMCQGMCFSLPTLDDPFNERHGRMDINVKDKKKKVNTREFVKGKNASLNKETLNRKNGEADHLKRKNEKLVNLRGEMKNSIIFSNNLGQKIALDTENRKVQLNGNDLNHQEQACDYSDGPSKFFILCLNAIEKALRHDGTYNDEEKPLLVNPWGLEFLKFCSIGKDILETSGSSCTIEQIAWIVSIAADAIARKEKEGLSFSSPFLLFLVPSQEKAAKVRMVCKPLKDLGVHTVSLHAGASLDHQIRGLKSCEPEFLVSTPERLMELISLKAIDITGVSFLVVDGLDSLYQDGSLGSLKSIRQSISGNPHTVAFNNLFNHACVPALQNLFVGSINRLSLSDSICSQSACIFQTIEVCTSEQKKLSKVVQVLRGAYDDQLCSHRLKLLFIVENNKKAASLVKILKSNGYSVSTESNCEVSNVDTSLDSNCRMKPVVSVINAEHISTADLGVYEIIILPNFVLSIDNYIQILTRMARHTTHGILHSFMTEEDALLAGPLIEILEQCGQAVPETLRTLHLRSSMSE
ncbi:ATP-dependent RNA helicase DBP3 [Ricinus communis]|uniref:ATP-dependent RNA helicase DBP3 n=1 Tax=Ricinus communis TaxID=3988 RepID=UPI00077252E0|nr:ATP-dependent RNA helicase DBP3 [Ricinus communis]|eukprot:XP_015581917.1 ATP-dependent RNA helicase DBP3 [Ricinus communis]